MIYSIGVKTGFRISDILRIEPKMLKGHILTIKEQKTGHIRSVLVTEKQRQYIKSFDESERVFKMSRQAVYKYFKDLSKRLDIERVGTHSMRKKYCKNYKKGIYNLQKDLGHEHLSTTLLYMFDE